MTALTVIGFISSVIALFIACFSFYHIWLYEGEQKERMLSNEINSIGKNVESKKIHKHYRRL